MGRSDSKSGSSASKTPDIWDHIERLEATLAKAKERANEEAKSKKQTRQTESKNEDSREDDASKDEGNETKAEDGEEGGTDQNTEKASLIQEKDELSPEQQLKYIFGRRSNASGERKDLCEVWELGGGDKLLGLADIVLQQQFPGLVVVCVDLSAPEDAFEEATSWMNAVRKRRRDIPLMLVATKHDRFENEDGLKRKALAQALRYAACVRKAGLIFVSKKDKAALTYYRAFLNQYAFEGEKKKTAHVDPNKPIIVAPGRDSLSKIGLPPGVTEKSPQTDIEEAWRTLLQDYFPRKQPESKHDAAEDEDTDIQERESENLTHTLNLETEPIVDKHRMDKDKELQRYRARASSSRISGR
eukprot:CAMPEP_0171564720 /NCGR_PEP_ID=MMETSP0960-20121227/16456_1 /TAXON_ID=87120 /ORGANISM="Aurantiochytrium limacinum, Strain ATCCMYA-1381" /LENGTH=357 /DNA_ID=CAMNT_0012118157 /DNA_START=75 /DNA_END=1147 /DNA_ORIENTATION=+